MNLRRLDAYFRRLVEEGLLPGAVVLVARGGEVVFQGVYGYLDPGRGLPMREDALFRLYSMTKPWVSALALSFVEEGTLSLLDPVEKYLPEFSGLRVGREVGEGIVYEPLKRPLTVYDLLRHTAGLTYGVFFRSPVKGLYLRAGVDRFDLSREVFLERLAALPLRFQPGETFEYGLATDLLGHLLEALAGRSLAELLEERLFRPLGMRDSGFQAKDPARLAQPFPKDPETGHSLRLLPVETPRPGTPGGWGAWAPRRTTSPSSGPSPGAGRAFPHHGGFHGPGPPGKPLPRGPQAGGPSTSPGPGTASASGWRCGWSPWATPRAP